MAVGIMYALVISKSLLNAFSLGIVGLADEHRGVNESLHHEASFGSDVDCASFELEDFQRRPVDCECVSASTAEMRVLGNSLHERVKHCGTELEE